MPTQDISVWDETGSKAVDVITDINNYNRLCVDANVSGGTVSMDRLRPAFSYRDTVVNIPSQTVDTTLATISWVGAIDMISVKFSSARVIFVLEVDGVEKLRIDMENLSAGSIYGLGQPSSNKVYFPIVTYASGTQIILTWMFPANITNGIVLKARRNSNTNVNMLAYMVVRRDKI